MVPGKYDITFHRGATWTISVEAKNNLGSNVDFGAYDSMRLQVGKSWIKKTGSDLLLSLTNTNGRIALADNDQTLILTLTAAETAQLNFHEGIYELELVKDATVDPVAAQVVDRILYGSVKVANEVVR